MEALNLVVRPKRTTIKQRLRNRFRLVQVLAQLHPLQGRVTRPVFLALRHLPLGAGSISERAVLHHHLVLLHQRMKIVIVTKAAAAVVVGSSLGRHRIQRAQLHLVRHLLLVHQLRACLGHQVEITTVLRRVVEACLEEINNLHNSKILTLVVDLPRQIHRRPLQTHLVVGLLHLLPSGETTTPRLLLVVTKALRLLVLLNRFKQVVPEGRLVKPRAMRQHHLVGQHRAPGRLVVEVHRSIAVVVVGLAWVSNHKVAKLCEQREARDANLITCYLQVLQF
mmetsp:Transcript_1797/g.2716  ORF Transcript_1797/g.2716 Transcript_1797/m.2716 type:complete len:280 (+) Transcript_1797:3548-4387(+)